jgi:hypothetical protein
MLLALRMACADVLQAHQVVELAWQELAAREHYVLRPDTWHED